MTEDTLDRASEIAKETMAQLEAEEKEQAKASEADAQPDPSKEQSEESKGASDEEPVKDPQEETKTEGNEEEPELQSEEKTDDELMEADDEGLSVEEQARKKDLIEKEEGLSAEEKIARIKEKTQKRIDQLTAELKTEKESRGEDKQKIDYLESELGNLKQSLEESGSIDTPEKSIEKILEANINKAIEEDAELPFNERREMSDDDLEQFLLEDMVKANRWIQRNELRHDREREKLATSRKAVSAIDAKTKEFYTKFPKCNQEARHRELMASGKTGEEAIKIIADEVPEFKTMIEIFREKPELADVNNPDAPELTAKEMEKRLGKTSSTPKTYTEEELEQAKKEAVEAEMQRRSSIDSGLSNSNRATTSPSEYEKNPNFKEGLALFIKAGEMDGKKLTKEDYIETLKEGKRRRGYDSSTY